MKKLFILFIVSLASALSGYAQAPDVLPQVFSPNAAELGKYGKVPVSYFNGLPNISIPLTELKAKDYTLPIYLTYHAGGNKPEQHPGWVGLGWTLHAGGCINRIIKGRKDEMTRWEAGRNYDENPGYYYHSDEFQSIHWEDSTVRSSAVLKGGFDYEPDEFQVNVEGINASFYFVGREKVRVVSKSDVDFTVSCKMNEGASVQETNTRILEYRFGSQSVRVYDSFFEFVITSKDGTKYYFGGFEDAIEYSITPINLYGKDYYGSESDWYFKGVANTWMLTKIIRPNGEEIVFSYKRAGAPVVKVDSHRVIYSELNGTPYPAANTFQDNGNIQYYILLPTYLKSIHCKYGNNELKFNTRPSCQLSYDIDRTDFCEKLGNTGLFEYLSANNSYEQLESIEHKGDKKVNLDYSNDPDTRLRLDSLMISALGCDTLKYRMTYDGTSLPRYNSRMTDIWGYYNCISPYNPSERDTGESYVPNINLLRAEMLTKIEYPTGGWTEFEYEPHDYCGFIQQEPLSLVRGSAQAGGLRIKKIVDETPDHHSNERQFFYTADSGFSSGISSGRPTFLLIRNIDLGG